MILLDILNQVVDIDTDIFLSINRMHSPFFDYFMSAYSGKSTTSADERFSQKLYEIIEKNISDQNLGIEMLCDQIGISRANLYRKIKAISELSPTELIRNKRLEVALRYLKETNMSVSEVATLLGFNSHSYFSNSFKAFYGFTPTYLPHIYKVFGNILFFQLLCYIKIRC